MSENEAEIAVPIAQHQPLPTAFELSKLRLQNVRECLNNRTLIEGEDYGVIPGTQSKKPTLLKPGAQKLCMLFDLSVEIKHTERVLEEKLISFEITVALRNKQTGVLEGEGVGLCNSRERKYANKSAYDVANTLLKMAEKRALVDATLNALGIASLFTQDLEDMDLSDSERPQNGGGTITHRQRETPQFQTRGQVQQTEQATPPKPPTPPHIVSLREAMKVSGTPYTPDTFAAWTAAVNQYFNETGDGAPITKLNDLTPEMAADAKMAIEEKLLFYPSAVEPAEVAV